MNRRDRELLEEVLDELECQFWACDGPTLRPVDMVTCRACALRARIAKRLGVYIPIKERKFSKEEWRAQARESILRKASHYVRVPG